MLKIVIALLACSPATHGLDIDASLPGGNISLTHISPGNGSPTSFTLNTRDWVILKASSTPPVIVISKPDEPGGRELMRLINDWLSRSKIAGGLPVQPKGMYHLRLDTAQGSLSVGVVDAEGSVLAEEMKEMLGLFATLHAASP